MGDLESKPAEESVVGFSREGFVRLEWEQPLSELRKVVTTHDNNNSADTNNHEKGRCLFAVS